jgi:hypothetical protein
MQYLNYSQIWLNPPRQLSHFHYIFLWTITTLSVSQNSSKKKTHYRAAFVLSMKFRPKNELKNQRFKREVIF